LPVISNQYFSNQWSAIRGEISFVVLNAFPEVAEHYRAHFFNLLIVAQAGVRAEDGIQFLERLAVTTGRGCGLLFFRMMLGLHIW